tara:strand:- start:37 stop:543 length:507 start_codon:yes stop_codon:yes gene_type:complete
MTKINPFNTETLNVQWSHLHRPDDKFGADAANHNITVVVDDELQMKLEDLKQEHGSDKINGLRTNDDGVTLLKVKTKLFVKDNIEAFPCRDASDDETNAIPFGGDKVRLRLKPAILTRDGSMSLYLNGCQIIEKGEGYSNSSGFSKTEGFTGNVEVKEADTDADGMPF